MFKNRSIILFISAILGLAYCVYIIIYVTDLVGAVEGAERIGAYIASLLAWPHIICVVLATIFNSLSFFLNSRGFAITAGVLYSVGAFLFMIFLVYLVPMIVLSFVGVANVTKITRLAAVPAEAPTEDFESSNSL